MRRLQEEPSYWAKGRGLMTAGVEGFVDAGTCCWEKKKNTTLLLPFLGHQALNLSPHLIH